MSFYDDPKNVKSYIEMCEGYDGRPLYERLYKHLPINSKLLELGSGGGLDLDFLKQKYSVVGSDVSEAFLNACRLKHPTLSFLTLNAEQLQLSETFDCIYSNKVLQHLSKESLKKSIYQQTKLLSINGIIAHSFWIGEGTEVINGLLFTYYRQEELVEILSEHFEILDTLSYQEFEEGDSLFILAKLK